MSLLKFAVLTFGCRTNQADSSRIERDLAAAGGCEAAGETADVVVVNTCTVTAAADQAARQAIRRVARANAGARIVVTGCYATRRPGDLAGLPGVVELVPNDRKHLIALSLAGVPLPGPQLPAALPFPGRHGRTTYPLTVQTGCDECCSYCIVPSTRGPSRSLPFDGLLAEARLLSVCGFLEIVLTGVHLGAYGRDLSPARSLTDLLAAFERLPGSTRFRLSSLEPMDCPPSVVETLARSRRFAHHLHLPLQHASDAVLRSMRRPYTIDSYRRLVDGIRERLPDAAIGTDIIVGFPGERDDDVERLERYLEGSPITHLHVFPFSARPGTVAATLAPRVERTVARERATRLRAVGRMLTARFEASQVGRSCEGITLKDGSVVLTDNFLKVAVPPGRRRNERVRVVVRSATPLQGEVT